MGLLYPPSPFAPPTITQRLLTTPLRFLFHLAYIILLYLRGPSYSPPPNVDPIKVVCISDTHCKNPLDFLPPGDLLIHAGDLTNLGTVAEIQRQIDWLKSIHGAIVKGGFSEIIVICGNHDSYFDVRSRSGHDRQQKQKLDWGPIKYLEHSATAVTIHDRTLNVYGAPQIPKCGGKEFAFQYPRGQDAWSGTIPDDVDVLVTHTPPKTHLDIPLGPNAGMGCEWLLKECWRAKPTLHVFGHVHSGYGMQAVWWDEAQFRYERIMSRPPRSFGALGEVFDFRLWIEGAKLLYHGAKGVLWSKFWGGAARGGLMINASLTWQTTDRLDNDPQVVYL
ncbi:hypothetical protein GJ744_012466 [Endocarpon pusillum]|uniref:Calcineurin-like phosphoesterase domain-containing protein n=1 Tax=Endocarpon pusillum TaxID=364733 RepID=A0A8H7AD32_9EURO|nr:hypothetical protein GJ744_012466 [Endocarpon pusillum]